MSDGLSAPTIDEIKAQPWEDVARSAEIPTYSYLQTKFSQTVGELEKVGDTAASAVYRFLGQICFIHLQPDNKDHPLRAGWVSATGRSAAIEDFDEQARGTNRRTRRPDDRTAPSGALCGHHLAASQEPQDGRAGGN